MGVSASGGPPAGASAEVRCFGHQWMGCKICSERMWHLIASRGIGNGGGLLKNRVVSVLHLFRLLGWVWSPF